MAVVPKLGSSAITLQAAYNGGNSITLAGGLAVSITAPAAGNVNCLVLTNNDVTSNPGQATLKIVNNATDISLGPIARNDDISIGNGTSQVHATITSNVAAGFAPSFGMVFNVLNDIRSNNSSSGAPGVSPFLWVSYGGNSILQMVQDKNWEGGGNQMLHLGIVQDGLSTTGEANFGIGVYDKGSATARYELSELTTANGIFIHNGATGAGSRHITIGTDLYDNSGAAVLPSYVLLAGQRRIASVRSGYNQPTLELQNASVHATDILGTSSAWNISKAGIFTGTGGVINGHIDITGTAGAGFITLVAQASNPTAPAAGTLLLHSVTTQGFTRMEQDNEAATNLVLGRDNVFIAKNTSGGSIAKGKVVYITGSTGNVPNIALARANSASTIPEVGVALDTIADNAFGQVMVLGVISNINTSAFASGDQIWVSTSVAGGLQNTRPSGTSGAYVLRVGSVMVSGVGNGSIIVDIAPFIGNIETGTLASTWTGNNVTLAGILTLSAYNRTTDTVSGDSTLTDTTVAQDIAFTADSTTTDLTITTTYNFTGILNTQGHTVKFWGKVVKGITAASRTHTAIIQINGVEVCRLATANGTAASTEIMNYTFTYNPVSGTWRSANVLVESGNLVRPSIAFIDDPTTGIYSQQAGRINFTLSGAHTFLLASTGFRFLQTAASMFLDSNGNELLKFTQTTSAVNEITVKNDITGVNPSISATGGDTNIGITLTPKGTGGVGIGIAATAILTLKAGTATASTAPLKFTSGTNLTTAEAGAMEYNGTNLFFTRAGTVRENILVAIDNVAAPTTSLTPTFTSYYGGNTNALGDPNRWLSVNVLGATYKIPLYT